MYYTYELYEHGVHDNTLVNELLSFLSLKTEAQLFSLARSRKLILSTRLLNLNI